MQRNLETEKRIGMKQWAGDYWGPEGAVALMHQYLKNLVPACPDIGESIFVNMTLASLYYSAAGSATAKAWGIIRTMKILSFWQLPMWAWRTYNMLNGAWKKVGWACDTQQYLIASRSVTEKFSAQDLDVLQSIVRKWYRLRRWFTFDELRLQTMRDLAQEFINQGLTDSECTDISKCLLLAGRADLLSLETDSRAKPGARVRMFETLIEIWEIAMKIHRADPDDGMAKGLVRVFKHLAAMSQKLIPFDGNLPGQDHREFPANAAELHAQAKLMHDVYLDKAGSVDQKTKAGVPGQF